MSRADIREEMRMGPEEDNKEVSLGYSQLQLTCRRVIKWAKRSHSIKRGMSSIVSANNWFHGNEKSIRVTVQGGHTR